MLPVDYIEYLGNIVSSDADHLGNRLKLFRALYCTPYVYDNPLDENLAFSGLSLRERYLNDGGIIIPERPCTLLEMLVSLAIDCEVNIMQDDRLGDRTSCWFWMMIDNLGLGQVYDDNFDEPYVENILYSFLRNEVSDIGTIPKLFIFDDESIAEGRSIWQKLCLYLNTKYKFTI